MSVKSEPMRPSDGIARGADTEFKRRVLFTVFVAAGVIVLGMTVWEARLILLLLFAGSIGALTLSTLAALLQKWVRIGRKLAFATVLICLTGSLGALIAFRGPAIVQRLNGLQTDIPAALQRIYLSLAVHSSLRSTLAGVVNPDQISSWLTLAAAHIGGVMTATAASVAGVFIVVFASIYLGAEPDFYLRKIRRLIPPNHRSMTEACLESAAATLRSWLMAKLISMTSIGILITSGLWILQVPFAGTLGVMAALLTFIPNIGAIISVVLASLLAFAITPLRGVLVILLFLTVHVIEGNVITPLAERSFVKLPPVMTLFFQLLLGSVAGVLGIALAAPLLAAAFGVSRVLLAPDAKALPADSQRAGTLG